MGIPPSRLLRNRMILEQGLLKVLASKRPPVAQRHVRPGLSQRSLVRLPLQVTFIYLPASGSVRDLERINPCSLSSEERGGGAASSAARADSSNRGGCRRGSLLYSCSKRFQQSRRLWELCPSSSAKVRSIVCRCGRQKRILGKGCRGRRPASLPSGRDVGCWSFEGLAQRLHVDVSV
jgi:hypothetical protein